MNTTVARVQQILPERSYCSTKETEHAWLTTLQRIMGLEVWILVFYSLINQMKDFKNKLRRLVQTGAKPLWTNRLLKLDLQNIF